MKEIILFNFKGNDVREITDQNGDPWFVAKDVCSVLEVKNTSQALSYLDDDERCLITDESFRNNGETAIINESGLYSLILRSRKPEAKSFKKWITSEVLPSIRKTGGYHIPKTYPEALRALADSEEKKEMAELKLGKARNKIKEDAPKVETFDKMMASKGYVLPFDAGMIICKHPKIFTKWCIDNKYLSKPTKRSRLKTFTEFENKGYMKTVPRTAESDGITRNQTYFTPEGLIWIRSEWDNFHNNKPFELEA